MIGKYSRKVTLAMLIGAVLPPALAVGIMAALQPAALSDPLHLASLLEFVALTAALALVFALGATTALYFDLRRQLGLAARAVRRGALLPADELSDLLAGANARVRELAALRETTLDLTAQLDMSGLLTTIVERATKLMEVTGGVIYEADPARRRVRLMAAVGLHPDPLGHELDFGEGLAGQVAASGALLVVPDYQRWSGRSKLFEGLPLYAVIGVPLRWQGLLIGVLNIEDEEGGRTFSERDVALAEQFGNQAALAIGNARLYAAANRQAERLRLLHEGSQAITRSLELDAVYQATYQAVGRLMPNEAFSIRLLNEAGEYTQPAFQMDKGIARTSPAAPPGAGLTGRVLAEKRPLLARNAGEIPAGGLQFGDSEPVQSLLAVPLQVGDEVFGALITESYQPNAFSEEDVPLLVTLANQAAVAVQNARSFQSMRRQLAELGILHGVVRAAVSTAELDQVITRAMQALRALVRYDHLSLYLLDQDRKQLHLHPSFMEIFPGEPVLEQIPRGRGITGRVAESGQPARLGDVARDPDYLALFPGTRSELCVPLKLGDWVVGVLNAEADAPEAFSAADERLLTILAGILAPMIENARLVEHDRRRLNELSLLTQIALATVTAPNLSELLDLAVEALQQPLGYAIVGVGLLDESGNWITLHPTDRGPEGLLPLPALRGLAGAAIQSGKPVRVDDVRSDPRYHMSTPATRSELAIPLKVGERVIGFINTESTWVAAYTQADERLLTVVASLLAPIIDNARLRARAEQHARELDLLFRAQSAASASLDLGAVLTAIAEQIAQALDGTSAYVCELDAAEHTTVVAEWFTAEASTAERVSDLNVRYGPELAQTALLAMREGRPVITGPEDPLATEAERRHRRQFGVRSILVVPLMRQGVALGYVELWDALRERTWSAGELRLAQTMAGNAAAALENAQLYQAAQRQAEQMRLINEVGRAIAGILDVNLLTTQVGRTLETTFGYYQANVGLIDGDELVFRQHGDQRRNMIIPEARFPLDGAGIVAWVSRTGQPWSSPDVTRDPHFVPNPYFPDTRSEAALPLMVHNQVVGVLDVQSAAVGGLGPADLATLQALSGQLAVGIENARLFAEARHRADEVAALLATTLGLSSTLDLGTRLTVIAQHAQRLVNGDSSTIYRLDAETDLLHPIMALDEKYQREVLASDAALGQGITGFVAKTGVAELINRVDLDPRAVQIPGTPVTPESMICVPLRVGDRVTGVISVYKEGLRDFEPHDLELIASFAAQAAVAIENDELYQALVERAESLQAAYNELARMDRLKDEMVQNISHELRTPITFLKSYVDLLLSGELGQLRPQQEKSLRVVANKTETLVRLVNDIITLQAVTPATIQLAPLDLNALAQTAADGVAVVAQQAGLRFTVNLPREPVPVHGDSLRLSQVFDNLLGNAVKFTQRGGDVGLLLQPARNAVRVEVRDTGQGIERENLGRVFDRFYQVDGTPTRRRGGIGLGLSICKLIVESHGGYIGVDSTVGYGSCFYFVLPLAPDNGADG